MLAALSQVRGHNFLETHQALGRAPATATRFLCRLAFLPTSGWSATATGSVFPRL